MPAYLAFPVALSVTVLLLPLLIRLAPALGLLDQPGPRKVHARAVPRVGGLAIAAGAGLAIVLFGTLDRTTAAVLAGAAVLLAAGAVDDRQDLHYAWKLLAQVCATAIVVVVGEVRIDTLTFVAREPLPEWLVLPLTVGFLVGITNAINLTDGLDGLAGGTTLIVLAALALLAPAVGDPAPLTLALALGGAILGFLRFNSHPARVFMGDAGSQLLGFTAGVVAIGVTQPETSAISASLPLLVLGLPIIDTLLVFGQRLAERRSPFSADQNHVHHRLLRLGFDHTEAVVAIYLFQGGMLVLAYLLRFESDLVILGTFATVAATVVGGLYVAGRARTRHPPAPRPGGSRVRRLATRVLTDARVPRTIVAIAALALPVYGLSVLVRVTAWPADVALLAGLLAALAVLLSVARRTALHWGDRVVLSVTAVLLAYLGHTATDLPPWAPALELAVFAAVGALVFLWMRSSGAGRFETTPLDVLVMFAALVLPNLPGTGAPGIGALVFKAIVLLYAAEVTLASGVRPLAIRVPLVAVLLAVPLGWSLAG